MLIDKVEIFPKEIYLIEQFLSYEYYYETVKLWEELIEYAEELLDKYSAHLAPDHRAQHPSHQADYVWGTIVLPNFKATLHHLIDGLEELKEGYLPILGRMSSVGNDIIAQERDYPCDWMGEINKDADQEFQDKITVVSTRANNIYVTFDYSPQWDYKWFEDMYSKWGIDVIHYNPVDVGVKMSNPLPIYRLNYDIRVETDHPIMVSGIYRSTEPYSACKFLMKEKNIYDGMFGDWVTAPQVRSFQNNPDHFTKDTLENSRRVKTTWILVERVTEQNNADIILNNSKISQKGGAKVLKTGYWTTPAQPNTRSYFKKDEILPKLSQTDWGEVYWYFDGEE